MPSAKEGYEALSMTAKRSKMTMRMDSCLLGERATADMLVQAVDDGDLHLFREIVSSEGRNLDVNEELGEEHGFSTPLLVIVAAGKLEFAKVLLRHDAIDPDKPHVTGKRYPIHVAAEKADLPMLELLLAAGADPASKMENGSTALHVLAARSAARWCQEESTRPQLRRSFVACARLLVGAGGVNVDAANNIGVTAAKLAAEKGSEEMARLLVAEMGAYVDSETEETLEERMPELLKEIDLAENRTNRDSTESALFQTLYDEMKQPGQFVAKWREAEANNNAKVNLDATDGCYTFLQLACDRGMVEVSRFLLKEGADPNMSTPNMRTPPLLIAAHHGYYKLVQLFVALSADVSRRVDFGATDGVKDDTVLHRVLKAESKAHHNYGDRDYARCLAVLLDRKHLAMQKMIQPALDAQDQLGNTPLHVAAFTNNDDAIGRLLRCGANIGVRNSNDQTPIGAIAPEIMEEFLDDCLQSDGTRISVDFVLMFRYAFLGPPLRREWKRGQLQKKDSRATGKQEEEDEEVGLAGGDNADDGVLPESEPLWHLSQSPDHRHLLTHPVVSSFLCLKWRRMRPFYYANLGFYLAFVALLTCFVLLLAVDEGDDGSSSDSSAYSAGLAVSRWGTAGLLVLLALRELSQASISCRRYFFNLENLMEAVMVGATFALVFCQESLSDDAVRYLSASALLLSWAEMVLMFGRHPKMSNFIAMFSAVSWNFLQFLAWYSSIIVAFALTFFVLLKRPPPAGDDDEEAVNGYFSSASRSLLKTVVMSLTGEIEFEGIDFGGLYPTFLFLLYVFFVMLVLVNLLNGLAVSDIQEIQRHAEIVSHVARIELISYMESMLLGDPFAFLSDWPPHGKGGAVGRALRRLPPGGCCRASLYSFGPFKKVAAAAVRSVLLFQRRLRRKVAVFAPNKSRYESSLEEGERDNLRLERSILSRATDVAIRSRGAEERDERLAKVEKALALIAEQNNHIIEKLNGK